MITLLGMQALSTLSSAGLGMPVAHFLTIELMSVFVKLESM